MSTAQAARRVLAVGEPALSRSAVDRTAGRRHDPSWLAAAWRKRGRLLRLDEDLAAPVVDGPALRLEPTSGDSPAEALFLGDDGTFAYFALDGGAPSSGPYAALRDVGAEMSDRDAGLFVHAVALATWHRAHRRCPRCGAATAPGVGGSVRRCHQDGGEHFPRTDPAMIVLVTSADRERAVLGRPASWPAPRFTILAGFVEPGESVEQTVVREVAEEVGLTVRDLCYVASQPWPFPASLMLGFTAVATTEDLVLDPAELAEARWYSRDQLNGAVAAGGVVLPPPVSIARKMIDAWRRER
ncbi:MAG TPA: NAD(+) diphosphatase [Frankiaceae bacterium]|nr:NAD(+) diphosphatase [Frankiaceae bacterium]